jgi:hypothetical protein
MSKRDIMSIYFEDPSTVSHNTSSHRSNYDEFCAKYIKNEKNSQLKKFMTPIKKRYLMQSPNYDKESQNINSNSQYMNIADSKSNFLSESKLSENQLLQEDPKYFSHLLDKPEMRIDHTLKHKRPHQTTHHHTRP